MKKTKCPYFLPNILGTIFVDTIITNIVQSLVEYDFFLIICKTDLRGVQRQNIDYSFKKIVFYL
jgi:hypothetical protein